MKQYTAPDINAPRFRAKRATVVTQKFLTDFANSHPEHPPLSVRDVNNIIKAFNAKVVDTVINTRDGFELPKQLGYIFMARCLPKLKSNVDYKTSEAHEKVVQHKNWNSDDFLCKVFYTNHASKFSFLDHKLWSALPAREFSRAASDAFKTNWVNCIQVDHTLKIAKLYRKRSFKQYILEKENSVLENYNEFEF